jgi:hypothetical protein
MKAKRQNRTLSVSVTMLDGSGGHVNLTEQVVPNRNGLARKPHFFLGPLFFVRVRI